MIEEVKDMENLQEKKYRTAEILMFFEDAKARDKAFGVLLDHDEDVYRFDAHYGPAFPGAETQGAIEKGLIIYAEIFEDVDKEVPEFVEDMQSLIPVDIKDYRYNPIAESMHESRMADVEILCDETVENNPKASAKDIAERLKGAFDISDEHALEFAEDFLKSHVLNESKEKTIEVDFPIEVNEKGRIKANDAKKLLKHLNKLGILRVGRTYFVKDSTGNETCWDLTKDTFDGFLFSCEVTEVNGEEVDFYNALYFSKNKKGLVDFEWEAHKVESMEVKEDRLKESIQISDNISIEDIEIYDDDYLDYTLSHDGYCRGDVYVTVTFKFHDETAKEIWAATDCEGKMIPGDEAYDEYGSEIFWYDCLGDVYFEKYIDTEIPSEDYAFQRHFWDELETSGEANKSIKKAIKEFIKNGCRFTENSQSPADKLIEALTYKYRIVLDQPEGSNYRLTNSDKLKFKTEEEAQKRLDDMMKYMGDRLKAKGMGLKIEEIQPKERKKRASYKDNPDFVNPYKVGDILDTDVGYSMSLPEFWEIVKVSDASVVAKKLKSKIVSQDNWGQSGYKIPAGPGIYDDYHGQTQEIRLQVKAAKFPRYYGQTREEFDKELEENPEKMCYLWGRGHLFNKWDGSPLVWDTYD